MIRRPPRSTRTDTLFPYTTLFRSYRRGYYDDGTPLGSHESDECRIDPIAQSWSVIAGGGDPAHAESAMEQVDRQLILRDAKVALLFTPPFEHTDHDPGYLQAYPPGLRENGGQYTHRTSARRVGKECVGPGRTWGAPD